MTLGIIRGITDGTEDGMILGTDPGMVIIRGGDIRTGTTIIIRTGITPIGEEETVRYGQGHRYARVQEPVRV